ncbi:unnamed protein product [Prorocentrum cordatum]|uniref:2',3'-cyclic-nucleotide 3'-phosphodiesterase n=1 Tax=Prorocentrum cordatum TaxID=2364126 RepID=A0ABN9TV17_9DINO|nr:unnamed protein product [Polarella glacialis]
MPSAGRVAEYAEFFRLVSDCLVATGPEVAAAAAAAGAAARAAAQNGQAGTASKAPEPAQGAAGLASKRPRPPPDAGGAGEADLEAKRARPGEKEDAKAKRSSRAAQLAARLAQLEQKAAALQEMSKKRAEEREKQLADAQEEEAEREEPEDAQQGPEEDEDDGMGINAQQRAIADPSFPFRKVCYLMRGPPGCGKSTTARKLLQYHLKLQGVKWTPGPDAPYSPLCRAFVLSTDDFFTFVDDQGEAEYRFDPKKLKEFHPKNQARFENCCELGRTPLFVDNTNIALWEMKDYLLSAEKYGYEVEVVDPREFGEDALNPDVLDQRCQAGAGADRAAGKTIPYAVLDRMCRNLEELPEPANCPTGPEALEAIRNSSNPFGDKGGGKGGGKGGFGGGKGGGFQPPMMQKGGFHQPPPWAGSVGSEIRPKQQAYVPPQVVARPPRPPPEPAAPAAPVTLPKQRMKCTPPQPPAALQQPPEPEAPRGARRAGSDA